MKKVKIERTMEDVISSNNGLSLYLSNLSEGRKMTDHSWLYERENSNDTLQRWIPIMEAANNKTPFAELFNSFDLKQVEKFGPQGGIPPIDSEEVWEVIEPLYSPTVFDDANALSKWWHKAEEFGKMLFGPTPCRAVPWPYERVLVDMYKRDTLSTNSGYPRFTRRKKVQTMEVADARTGAHAIYPAIILFRYYYGKLRPVWMFPMSANLREASFASPIQSALRQSPIPWVRKYVTPWLGYDDVKRVMTEQWTGQQVVSGDTTKMDAHMRLAQMTLVYHIVKFLFQKQYWEDLHSSLLHVCDIDLLWDRQTMIIGTHGLASGSSWTQLSETVLQMFMAWCAGKEGQGIGDDFFWISTQTAEELVAWLNEFGLPANAAKQTVAEDHVTFLQRLNRQGFMSRDDKSVLGAYYPTIRALGSMLMPEKFHDPKSWNSDMFCVRIFTILENCVDDPSFDDFVSFVVHGQKDLIPFAKKSSSEIDEAQKLARTVPGLFPNYNQEKLTRPLSTYTAISIARKM
nr:MAG: RNA-dependent RNA-polymerase [Picobirnavirus sp.]